MRGPTTCQPTLVVKEGLTDELKGSKVILRQ
jgi:hypothetical protein